LLEIAPIDLIKPKPLKGFNGKKARAITQAIFPNLSFQDYTETLYYLYITDLGEHPIILGKPWMNKYGVILDMATDTIRFPSQADISIPQAEPVPVPYTPQQIY